MADLAVWQRTIVDEEGNVIPGAEIEVRREEDDSLATLYADRAGETPLANPLAADMSGFVRFFAQGDAYTITAVGAGSTRTWRFDPTGRLKEFDKVVAEIITDDAGGQSDIRDKLGAVSRTANLSDLTNLKEARANLGTYGTADSIAEREVPADITAIRTDGQDAPGDGRGGVYVWGEQTPDGIQSADGRWWEKVADHFRRLEADHVITVGAGGDFPNWQAALDFASAMYNTQQGKRVEIRLLSGHEIPVGLDIQHKDLGWIVLTAEDAVVPLSDGFTGSQESVPRNAVINVWNGRAPTLSFLIDAAGRGGAGYVLQRNSFGIIEPDCGILNTGGSRALYVNAGSTCIAVESKFPNANGRAAWVSRESTLIAEWSDFSGAKGDGGSLHGIRISRRSNAYLIGCDVSNCESTDAAVIAVRSYVVVSEADVSGSMGHGVVASLGSMVVANSTTAYNVAGDGFVAIDASKMVARNVDVNGCRHGFRAEGASEIDIGGASVTNETNNSVWVDSNSRVSGLGASVSLTSARTRRGGIFVGDNTTNLTAGLDVRIERNTGNPVVRINGDEDSIAQLFFGSFEDSTAASISYRNDNGTMDFRASGSPKLRLAGVQNAFYPLSDNAIRLGGASDRWSEVFAATGSINTSDERLKQDIRPFTSTEMEALSAVAPVIFRFREAVAEKGDAAREHSGVIAQQIIAAFTDRGLDPFRYGFLCGDYVYDTVQWTTLEPRTVTETVEDLDGTTREYASEVEVEVQHERQEPRIDPETGEHLFQLSVRYEELLVALWAAERQRLDRLESRLASLEARE